MAFWIAAGAFSIVVALALAAACFRTRAASAPAAAYDLQVYRDQLSELERDLARGIVAREEAGRARAEIARRILGADRSIRSAGATTAARGRVGGMLLAAGAAATIAGAFAVYARIGAPGYPDLPLAARIAMVEEARATRPGQDTAEDQAPLRQAIAPDPERAALVERLRAVVGDRPDDARGLRLLAVNEAALGDFRAARRAQGRLIDLLGADATGRDHADHAEMMVLAAGGYVSPEAEAALTRALERAPQDGAARYYAGLMFAQQGRADLAFPIWRALLADSRPEDPWVGPIRLRIEEVAALAGQPASVADLPPRPARPGPSPEDIAVAEALPPEDRAAMIEGMVSGLAARLAEEGGPPEDWARLIAAHAVLGHAERARAAYAEALAVFAGDADAVALITAAGAPLLGGAAE